LLIVDNLLLKGKLLDRNYRRTAKKFGIAIDSVAGDDLKTFPIEDARARVAVPLVSICTALLIGYGWALEKKAVIDACSTLSAVPSRSQG
jgi:hypothetical protein